MIQNREIKKQHSLKIIPHSSIPKHAHNNNKILASKTNKLQSNRSIEIYKCGCIKSPLKSILSVKQNKSQKLQKKTRSAIFNIQDVKQNKTNRSNVLHDSQSHKELLTKFNKLKVQYKSLEKLSKTASSSKVHATTFVPKYIDKIVDKVIQIDRPIQKIIKKIRKIPKEVVVYKNVQRQVDVQKQQLLFVDSEPLPAIVNQVYIQRQVAKVVQAQNCSNTRMKGDLQMLTNKSHQILQRIADSHYSIQNLKNKIQSCHAKDYKSVKFEQTSTNISHCQQDLQGFSPIKIKSENFIASGQLLCTSFLNSMASLKSLYFCEQSSLRNPECFQYNSQKKENDFCPIYF